MADSSSSSNCCSVFNCSGTACNHFPLWTLNGVNDNNSNNCNLYVVFDVFGSNQQIEIYKDVLYSQLVAIGQSSSSPITLSERNNSGIDGSVTWDSVLVSHPSTAILHCDAWSSSSSESSDNSLSTASSSFSSLSTSSSQSSSSNCCTSPFCTGECSNFSAWIFSGMDDHNSDNCRLYVGFEYIYPNQEEVRVYRKPSKSSLYLVSAGQGVSGLITLSPRNSSGLSGSVVWNGTPVFYTSSANLDCEISSSSSTSSESQSSKSSHSTTSKSSSSSSSSSKSSSLSLSSSSTSSSSSSSSSSIDSSSTSSESFGNVSSSSSSSLDKWNKTKPLILALSSINKGSVKNRLAQTVTITDNIYSIGKVFCYFYGPYGFLDGCTIHLDISICDDQGRPTNIIASDTIPGINIVENGWYSFTFNISGITPSNGYLSFIMWQENGDEDNYILWGYGSAETFDTKAWISNDNIIWEEQSNVIRAIKVVGSFNAYDLVDFRILTPEANKNCLTQDLSGGDLERCKLIEGNTYSNAKVIIDNPDFIASFVVDSSGSMGWNDRLSTRQSFITNFINKIKTYYPSNTLFDIVTFGSQIVDTTSLFSSLGKATTINIDINDPSRRTYVFSTNSSSSVVGDIYVSNGKSYTVLQTISSDDNLICMGNNDPDNSGILNRSSGSGDLSISFNSFSRTDKTNRMIAYGFKNLEDDHSYNISELSIDGSLFDSVGLNNWNSFTPLTLLSVGKHGPKDSDSLDFNAKENLVIRRSIFNQNESLETFKITSNISKGDEIVYLDDVSSININDYLDFIDGNFTSGGHNVVSASVSDSSITVNPPIKFDIYDWSSGNGIAQISNFNYAKSISSYGLVNILIRDKLSTNNVTFFMQTVDGLLMEWDIKPQKEWYVYNSYWLGETAKFPIQIFDVDGNPFPDGTRIIFYIDNLPPEADENDQKEVTYFTKDGLIGALKIYVSSIDDYNVNTKIDILDSIGDIQTQIITEKNQDDDGYFLKIDNPLQYNFYVINKSKIVISTTSTDQSNAASEISDATILPFPVSMVDVTPIYRQKNLDPSLLKPYDPPPVLPTTSYDDLNLDRDRIQINIDDIPTIDGYALARVLPVTEDNLKTKNEKDEEIARFLRPEIDETYTSQTEQNENDIEQAVEDASSAISQVFTTTTTTPVSQGLDYDISNPVFLQDGYAQGSMTTFSTDLSEETFDGLSVSGVDDDQAQKILAKKYMVYPSVEVKNDFNSVIARQFMDKFEVYFTLPITIYSTYNGGNVEYTSSNGYDECGVFKGYSNISVPGVYAIGNGFTIDYIITDKGALAQNLTLNVKIYSNRFINLEEVAVDNDLFANKYTRQDLTSVLPEVVTIDENGNKIVTQPLTEIDEWIQNVENNSAQDVVKDTTNQNYSDNYVDSVVDRTEDEMTKSGFVNPSEDEKSNFTYYTDPWDWTLATQYENAVYEQTITIIDGKATLTVPSSDASALLLIQASIDFGDNNQFTAIRSNIVFVANPINIGTISPFSVKALGEGSLYEIGTTVTWNGQTIDDNVVVNFSPYDTDINPAVSKTDGGWAGGVFLGPHPVFTMTTSSSASCAGVYKGIYENINITVAYKGYERTVSRLIEWTGDVPEDVDSDFYFKVNIGENKTAWADGKSYNELLSVINTSASDFDTEDIEWIGYDGIDRLWKGVEQNPPNVPRTVRYSGSSGDIVIDPPVTSWGLNYEGRAFTRIGGLNKNIGHKRLIEDNLDIEGITSNPPWITIITANTSYKNKNGKTVIGYGIIEEPRFIIGPSGFPVLVKPSPYILFVEPLAITLRLETYKDEFVRDGVASPVVVADVTWEGEPIIGSSLPTVTFESGVCEEGNSIPSNSEAPPFPRDSRNILSGCYKIGEHPSVSLSSYSSRVSLIRTDINDNNDNKHTHAIEIDSNGNGTTTQFILLDGLVYPHDHMIVNYVASSGGLPSHSHNVRSVAITNLNPMTDPIVNIAINGYVVYDPTNCVPYEDDNSIHGTTFTDGNRMMFATLYVNSPILGKELTITLDAGSNFPQNDLNNNFYTSRVVTDTNRGFDVRAFAKMSSYTVEDSPGHYVIIPERVVPDGTRVSLKIDAFKPIDADEVNNTLTVRPDTIKKYMYFKVSANVYFDGLSATDEISLVINSNIQWLPSVKFLVAEPTNDDIYLTNAISKISTLGSSQIYDAVKEAAQRIIQYQTDNPSWKTSRKAIFLLTDGDENMSENSINQSIDNVNFIDGKCNVPVIPVRLGYSYGSDEVLLRKYVSDTCGGIFYMVNGVSSDISNVLKDIIMSGILKINDGIYSNTIDLGYDSLASELSIDNYALPVGTKIIYRYRYSSDGIKWSSWSVWIDSSESSTFPLDMNSIGRYFQYQIHLYGDPDFVSPELYTGSTLCYYKSQNFMVFFEPVDLDINTNEYLASIHITHEATIPSTSEIVYGYTQFNSTNEEDYYGITRPLIESDTHTIILSRYNEKFLTEDNRTYTAINGRWPDFAKIDVYRISNENPNGELIDKGDYAVNNKNGSITFYNGQDPNSTILLCVTFDSLFRTFCKVTNYGPESATIDHIGMLYNIAQRIETDSSGNIIHVPISQRILSK